jgi:hypothetical protein
MPDGTTSHSTRLPKDGNQVAGYKSDKAHDKNRRAAYVVLCKQDFSSATQYGDGILDFQPKKCPQPKGEAGGKVLTESRHTLREEKRGMTFIIHSIR